MVVKHLNSDIGLTTEFFKFMLSRANLIQVNQFTARKDDGVSFSKFDVIWPPVFTGKIKFSASDFQSNKKPTSRLAFSVGNERGAGATDDKDAQEPDTGVKPDKKISAINQKIKKIGQDTTMSADVVGRPKGTTTAKSNDIGRERR